MTPEQPQGTPEGLAIFIGLIFWIFAVTLVWFAMNMDTALPSSVPGGLSSLYDEPLESRSVHNIGLMQRQMMMFQGGLACAVIGTIVFGVAAIRRGMEPGIEK